MVERKPARLAVDRLGKGMERETMAFNMSRRTILALASSLTNRGARRDLAATGDHREFLSVTDYAGCDPSGAADSTAAFSAAGSVGGRIHVPSGRYALADVPKSTETAIWELDHGVTVVGNGAAAFKDVSSPRALTVEWVHPPSVNNDPDLTIRWQFPQQQAGRAIQKSLRGPSVAPGSDSRRSVMQSVLWHDMQTQSPFAYAGQAYNGVVNIGARQPAKGSAAIIGGVVQVFDLQGAPDGVFSAEPCGDAISVNHIAGGAPDRATGVRPGRRKNGSSNAWGADRILNGPHETDPARREGLLVGRSEVVNKLSPGNTVDLRDPKHSKVGAYGFSLATCPGVPSVVKTRPDDSWIGLTTYPLTHWVGIGGYTGPHDTTSDGHQPTATPAAEIMLKIGGWPGTYLQPYARRPYNSKVKHGIAVLDHVGDAVQVLGRHPDNTGRAIWVSANGGAVQIDSEAGFGGTVTVRRANPQITLVDDSAKAGHGRFVFGSYQGLHYFQRQDADGKFLDNPLTFAANGTSVALGASLLPQLDAVASLGSPSQRFATLFLARGPVQTSDQALKTTLRDFTDAEIAAWGGVRAGVFRFLNSVDGEDENCCHAGYVAQDIQTAFQDAGLDSARYGLFSAEPSTRMVRKSRTVGRPRMETVAIDEEVEKVERIDGRYRRSTVTARREIRRPVIEEHPLFDGAGVPVMRMTRPPKLQPAFDAAGAPLYGADGEMVMNELEPAVWDQDVHRLAVVDEVEETYEVAEPDLDAAGQPLLRRGLRYDQCAVFEAAYQRRRADLLELRLAALEAQTASRGS